MSTRWLFIQLPRWPIQRLRRRAQRHGALFSEAEPFALVASAQGGPRLAAVDPAAEARGLAPGLSLADARALCPQLRVHPADPEGDAAALAELALWCTRWGPQAALDGADGIVVDIAGCAHLWGGEEGLLAAVAAAFRRLGLEHRAAIADRRLTAAIWARFGAGGIVPGLAALDPLPVEAVAAEEDAARLRQLGLRRIGELRRLPRATLIRRFGGALARRLDILEGAQEPPFVPLRAPARFSVRRSWPEPLATHAGIEAACRRLVADLCRELAQAGQGALRLLLTCHGVDGTIARLAVAPARPSRDPEHLFALFRLRLDRLALGFGVELLSLEAPETVELPAEQGALGDAADARAAAALIDRLVARLGAERVLRPEPVATHVPERAVRWRPAAHEPSRGPWVASLLRPLRLFEHPLAVRALALLPDGPPVRLSGPVAGRVVAASGPERILPEWWRPEDTAARPRDFFRLRLKDGREFWCVREGLWGEPTPPVWRLLGTFT